MMAEVYKWVPNAVARMAGDSDEMDRVAQDLYNIVLRRAIAHRLTGDYIDNLSVKNVPGKKGVRDRVVIAGDKAAYSIEWGHTVTRKDGTSYWLEGQHILGGAIAELPGERGTSKYP